MSSRKGCRYSSDAKEIVKNVNAFCKEEKENGLRIPLDKSLIRTASLTGVSKATVQRICQKPAKEEPNVKKPRRAVLDDFDKGVVRRTINLMYSQRQILPTVNNVLEILQKDIGYTSSRETLRKELKRMGYKFKRCKSNRKVLMEKIDVVNQRIAYLRKIKQLRDAGHPIIYTDETYVNTSHHVTKCWQHDTADGLNVPISKGERMIILHAGGENGFVPGADLVFQANSHTGDYHSEMNASNFTKWLTDKLIPNLPPGCVVVMDNAAYHNVQKDKCPTSAAKKEVLKDWLTRHGVSYKENMLKAELLQLCKMNKTKPAYVVDDLLQTHGHQALRLPPYHAELNPIELIWGILKGYIARHNLSFNLAKVKDLIDESMRNISQNDWAKCVGKVIKEEDKFREADIAVDVNIDKFVIELNSDSDSSNKSISSDSETDTASEAAD